MEEKLIKYLEHIEKLLSGLIELAERQQLALIRIDIKELEEITSYQSEISRNLREIEQQRIKYLMSVLSISFKEAASIKLSTLAKNLHSENILEYKRKLEKLTAKLYNLNVTNRILANRATSSVKELFKLFTNGSKNMCNVKI